MTILKEKHLKQKHLSISYIEIHMWMGAELAFRWGVGSGYWGEASLNPYQMGQNLCEYQLPANYRIVE